MALLEPPPETSNKPRVWIFAGGAIVVLAAIVLYFTFRFYPEQRAVQRLFDALVAADTKTAYQLWKPQPSYRFQDFLTDFGPYGYYGPVKSYKILHEDSPHGSNAVQIAVAISPFSPMPSPTDPAQQEKSHKTRVIAVWVVASDKSFTFPP